MHAFHGADVVLITIACLQAGPATGARRLGNVFQWDGPDGSGAAAVCFYCPCVWVGEVIQEADVLV